MTAIVLAGVAGTAITADLGARKIREELDALQVLGVDPIKNLVVPRFLALMLVTGLFDIYALLFGIFGGIFADARLRRSRSAAFFATLFTNASVTDLWGSVLKTHAVRRDHRDRLLLQGMTASGGAAGRRPRRQPGGRDRLPGRLRVQLRLHADAAGHPPRDLGDQVTRLARRPPGLARLVRARSPGSARASSALVYSGRGLPLLRRGAAPGRHPDPRLDDRHLGPGLHPRPAVRDRGRLLQPLGRRAGLRRRLRRLVRPARARSPTPSAT